MTLTEIGFGMLMIVQKCAKCIDKVKKYDENSIVEKIISENFRGEISIVKKIISEKLWCVPHEQEGLKDPMRSKTGRN